MLNEARTKSYPENYPSDAMAILDAMSFSGGKDVKVLGSMSLRSQQYAGDYDAYEIVKRKGAVENVLDDLVAKFKNIIKNLRGMKNVYIGDIKAGSIEEWRVIPLNAGLVNGKIVGYNPIQSKAKVDELYKAKVITEGEKRSADELLKDTSSPEDFLIARKKLKFHIVRWSVPEVLNGSKVVRGRRFTLQEAFSSPVISKLDTIGLVQNNKYTDFSIIYEFHADGKTLNPSFEDIGKSLSEDIIFYKNENNPFKVLKREFALAKFRGDDAMLVKLTPILNSDLGRLYSMLSDVGTMIALLEQNQNVPMKNLRYELDQFKSRMANVYSLSDFLKTEHTLLGHIASAMKTTSKDQLLTHLTQIEELIQASLTKNTPKKLVGGTKRTDFLKKHKLEDKGYSLKELAEISGEPLATLQEVYNRGIGAHSTSPQSVRMKGSFKKGVNAPMSKKLSKEQWAFARVYSYLQKNPKHDNDLRGGGDFFDWLANTSIGRAIGARIIKSSTSAVKSAWNRSLRGGSALNVGNLPPLAPSRTAAQKTAIANKLAAELKNAAHYFAYRAPATSLGYRTIADELFKKAPTLQGQPERKIDAGHDEATKLMMGRVIWGDQIPNRPKGTKTEFFSDVYKREVEPHFASVKASNPSMTHNEVQAYLEKNV